MAELHSLAKKHALSACCALFPSPLFVAKCAALPLLRPQLVSLLCTEMQDGSHLCGAWQAVGENNYRYFLAFLFMHWATLSYASWVRVPPIYRLIAASNAKGPFYGAEGHRAKLWQGCTWIMLGRLQEEKFWDPVKGLARIYDPQTNVPRTLAYSEVVKVMLLVENKCAFTK